MYDFTLLLDQNSVEYLYKLIKRGIYYDKLI